MLYLTTLHSQHWLVTLSGRSQVRSGGLQPSTLFRLSTSASSDFIIEKKSGGNYSFA